MGNSSPKATKLSKLDNNKWHSTQSQLSTISNISGRSTATNLSGISSWSRKSIVSRRTSTGAYNSRYFGGDRSENRRPLPSRRFDNANTAWPVSTVEALFLPEYPLRAGVNESHFQAEGSIAKGAFGKVVKVRRKETGVMYAMKILSKSHILSENAIQQCKDEVTIQRMCGHHSFIVQCHFNWQSKKHLFLVMDFVPYGELLGLWKKHVCLPEAVVKVYIGELALTLDHLHNLKVIYRDLKMENILLDKEGHVQLIDFGLAKWLNQGGRTRTICGTIQYMAPEVLRADSYTHAVDWWSLGVIMYALLTGKYPIDEVQDHSVMFERVCGLDYSLPREHSHEARNLCSKLLCKDPSNRLQSFRQLRWEPFFSDFNFDKALNKEISPNELLEKSLVARALYNNAERFKEDNTMDSSQNEDIFKDFPWVNPDEAF